MKGGILNLTRISKIEEIKKIIEMIGKIGKTLRMREIFIQIQGMQGTRKASIKDFKGSIFPKREIMEILEEKGTKGNSGDN